MELIANLNPVSVTADGVLAVMIGGSVARWEEALAAAEPVLESVRIGG